MSELEKLKKENAALLRATVRLGGTIEKLLDINNHFKNDKQKHIADIKADAVMEAAQSLFSYGEDAYNKDKLDEYANKLRSES